MSDEGLTVDRDTPPSLSLPAAAGSSVPVAEMLDAIKALEQRRSKEDAIQARHVERGNQGGISVYIKGSSYSEANQP